MREHNVPYTLGGGRFDLFVAQPDDPSPRPVVLVLHAWGGRDAFAEDKARALAELGYVGAAADLYGVGRRGTDRASSAALMGELLSSPERLGQRLEAALAAAVELPGADAGRAGAIGYCFGGLCALRMARMGLPLRGVVSFHGLLKVGEGLDARPRARMLVLHGQDDPMVPTADLATFADEMRRVGGDWALHVYPGAMHAFTNPAAQDRDFGTVYDADADRRSWATMRSFLAERLTE